MIFIGFDEDISWLLDICFGIIVVDDVGYVIGQLLVFEMGGELFCVCEDVCIFYYVVLVYVSNYIVIVLVDVFEVLWVVLSGGELFG